MPTAAATTHKVKSSREPVPATCQSSQGKIRRPTTSMSAIKTETGPRVNARVVSKLRSAAPGAGTCALPPSHNESGGSNTNAKTVTKSSTTSQPTAMWPLTVSRMPRLSSAFNSTTVLATDKERPKTTPPARLQPQSEVTAIPSRVATVI